MAFHARLDHAGRGPAAYSLAMRAAGPVCRLTGVTLCAQPVTPIEAHWSSGERAEAVQITAEMTSGACHNAFRSVP
jgi:hypothetical protein